ncbi:hypothetical protein Fmac_006321 [Flemingia macrophylla]|uniref:Uncharacterized protein n=1 Tax=Flemingia macrophylla TaxID=520843 RepID=A0ABD1NA89_9FABA
MDSHNRLCMAGGDDLREPARTRVVLRAARPPGHEAPPPGAAPPAPSAASPSGPPSATAGRPASSPTAAPPNASEPAVTKMMLLPVIHEIQTES